MPGPGQPQLVEAAALKRSDSKKRARDEPVESSEQRAAEQDAKRGRPDEPETSTCHQDVVTGA